MGEGDGGIFKTFSNSFFERFHSGPRKTLGWVRDVDVKNGRTFVNWLAETGEVYDFVFDPKSPLFKQAPEGFKVSDVIEMEMSGSRIISAKPLKLNENEKVEYTKRFRSIGEED